LHTEQKGGGKMEKKPRYEKYDFEKYFEKYPDVPKEVIIKEDIMRLGVTFTENALKLSEKSATKTYYIFSYDKMDVDEMKKEEHIRAPEEYKFKGGPYNLLPTNNKCIMAKEEDTPYKIDAIDGKVQLLWEGNYAADIEFRPRPSWYDLKLKDGTPYSDIVACVFWGYLPLCCVLRSCQYWGTHEECHFCDINATAKKQSKTGRPYMIFKSVEDVAEVYETIFLREKEPINHSFLLTGGAVKTEIQGKDNVEFYAQYVREIKKRLGNRWDCHVQTTALTKEECVRLKDAGVDVHH
jgi:hypothetical protein